MIGPFHPTGWIGSPILPTVEPRPLDPRLVDDSRAEEIALVAQLLIAARHDEARLSQAAIDEALGVEPVDPAEAPTSDEDEAETTETTGE